MKHASILELRVTHAFYTNGRCPDFAVAPSEETARLLRRHRCVLSPREDGIDVKTALDADTGEPFLPLPADQALRFYLEPQNNDFPFITDMSALEGLAAPVFTSAGIAPEAQGELQLVEGSAALPNGALAGVDVRLGDKVEGDAVAAFRIELQARQWRWAYYCVTDLPVSGGEIAIIDASPPGADDLLLFSENNRTNLSEQPDPSDPIAAQLASRYPGMRCIRMLSDAPVTCREEPRRYLELHQGDGRLCGPLPNPTTRRISRLMAPAPQDLLVEIVKYRADPFNNP